MFPGVMENKLVAWHGWKRQKNSDVSKKHFELAEKQDTRT